MIYVLGEGKYYVLLQNYVFIEIVEQLSIKIFQKPFH